MSDCSWAGSGLYSIPLVSNLQRTEEAMKTSISMGMQLSLYGFNSILFDVCGSIGDFNEEQEELCARWMQMGAFFPQIRNYFPYNESMVG